ncbi:MLO-like protein [Psidium guajava]|nr:MLO-like protein [Psidium guajava]
MDHLKATQKQPKFSDGDEKHKKQHSGVFFDMEGVQLVDKDGKENPRIFSYLERYISSNGFSENEVLGSGGFRRVCRAVLSSDGTVVTVKCVVERGERLRRPSRRSSWQWLISDTRIWSDS